ncbi:MAG: hypothetical protein E7318_02055 [Clostridiales bacterium]|nr:hypothetical protein [Clostridiales bacterium]
MLRHLQKRFTAVLLIALLLPCTGLGWERSDTISGNMCVEVCVDNQWHELPGSLRYSHENGILADGILMFLPLETYLEQHPLPTFAYTNTFNYRITCSPFVTSYKVSWTILRQSAEGLTPVADAFSALSELEAGIYLMRMQVAAEGHSGSCSNEYMFWLTKDGE